MTQKSCPVGMRNAILRNHLKLFLDIVPSSFADITRELPGCFRGRSVFVSFRFVLKQSKTSNSGDVFDILITGKGASTPASVCSNTFRNLNGSWNKRRMYPAQTITIEWTAEKCLDKWQKTTNFQTPARQPNKQMVESAGRRLLPKWQKAASAATVTTPKTTSIKQRLNIQSTNLARSWIHSVGLYSVRNIPNRIWKTASKFRTKEILKIGRRKVHVLSNKQNWYAYFTFCELLHNFDTDFGKQQLYPNISNWLLPFSFQNTKTLGWLVYKQMFMERNRGSICHVLLTVQNTHRRALLFIDNRQFIGFLHEQN